MSRAKAGEGILECPEFDLAMTLESGQTFHWTPLDGGYTGCIGDQAYHLRQEGTRLHYRGGNGEALWNYFALDHDLEAIRASCAGHAAVHEAAVACRGLRIMRQPHWECLASFILSPMKQVAHIRQMSLALRRTYGRQLTDTPVPAFPSAGALASTSEEALRACGLGFRAKGLLGTARMIAEGRFDPSALVTMDTAEARAALCALPGIGRKVANCILLFAYERLEAVPVDVWIGRILSSFRSPKSKKASPEQLERYGERLLGPYAGYIQQWLFHRARTGNIRLPAAKKTSQARPAHP
jgi:N-glycosylase/DNA lyase